MKHVMKHVKDMTMQELHDHCLNHPDHGGPGEIASLGVSFAKRWHYQQHTTDKPNHDHSKE
jgi:hypothetical protein